MSGESREGSEEVRVWSPSAQVGKHWASIGQTLGTVHNQTASWYASSPKRTCFSPSLSHLQPSPSHGHPSLSHIHASASHYSSSASPFLYLDSHHLGPCITHEFQKVFASGRPLPLPTSIRSVLRAYQRWKDMSQRGKQSRGSECKCGRAYSATWLHAVSRTTGTDNKSAIAVLLLSRQ